MMELKRGIDKDRLFLIICHGIGVGYCYVYSYWNFVNKNAYPMLSVSDILMYSIPAIFYVCITSMGGYLLLYYTCLDGILSQRNLGDRIDALKKIAKKDSHDANEVDFIERACIIGGYRKTKTT